MAIEGYDVCVLVWELLVADSGPGGVNTLVGGTPTKPGRIYHDQIPQDAALPGITVGLVAAPDLATIGGAHVLANVQVDVRVIGAGINYGPIVPIARRVNVVLDGAGGTTAETRAWKLARIDTRRGPADDGGSAFRQVIQTYATPAHPAAA